MSHLHILECQIYSFHLDLSPQYQRGTITRNLSSYNWVILIWRWVRACTVSCPQPAVSQHQVPSPAEAVLGVLGVGRVLLPAGNFVLQWSEEHPDASVDPCQTHPEGCEPARSTRPTSRTDECERDRRSHQHLSSTFFTTRRELPFNSTSTSENYR